jgi:hypothetical protein
MGRGAEAPCLLFHSDKQSRVCIAPPPYGAAAVSVEIPRYQRPASPSSLEQVGIATVRP